MNHGLTRRELLAGAGAASGLGLIGATFAGCGGRNIAGEGDQGDTPANLRGRLRALVDELERRFPTVTALALVGRRVEVAYDATESGVVITPIRHLLLQVYDGVAWFAQATDDLSPDSLVATTDRLVQRVPGGRGGERPTRDARPRDFSRRGGIELSTGAAGWQSQLGELFARTQAAGSSRVVYRGCYFHADDIETLFIGDGQDLRQSITRTRAGSVFVARDGRETLSEQAERSGTTGLAVMRVPGAALEAAARRVLTVPAGPPSTSADIDVILSPGCAAEVVRVGLASRLDARSWQSGSSQLADYAGDQIGDGRFTLVDDPTAAGAYGSYDFDDEGWLASRRVLIHRGVLRGPLSDRASARALGVGRTGHARSVRGLPPRPHYSNLIVEPGGATQAELVSDVKSGLLVEGPLIAECDPLRGRVLLRARRGLEISKGSLSGRVLGPIAVRGKLESLLLAVRGVGRDTRTQVIGGADSPAATIVTPMLLTRAEVGG